MKISRCKDCRAECFWAEMTSGKMNLVNFQPDSEAGNVRIVEVRHELPRTKIKAEVVWGRRLRKMRKEAHEPLYTSHFGTCPKRQAKEAKAS